MINASYSKSKRTKCIEKKSKTHARHKKKSCKGNRKSKESKQHNNKLIKYCANITPPLLDVILYIKNYEDQGIGHFWAIDSLCVRIKAYRMPDRSIFTHAEIIGKWFVIPGTLSPQSSTVSFCTTCTPYSINQQAASCGNIKAFEDFYFTPSTLIQEPNFTSSVPSKPVIILSDTIPKIRRISKCTTKEIVPRTFLLDLQGSFSDILLPASSQLGTARIAELVQAFFTTPFPSSSPLFKFQYFAPSCCPPITDPITCQGLENNICGSELNKQSTNSLKTTYPILLAQDLTSLLTTPPTLIPSRDEFCKSDKLLWYDSTDQIFGDVAIGVNGCPRVVPSNPLLTPPLNRVMK